MAIYLIDKIKPKNNGDFPMVDAEDVEMPDGTRLSDFKGGGSSITVDTALSETSENPVQNKVITTNFNNARNTLQYDVIPKLLPTVSAADNGKALAVVDGAWKPLAVSIPTTADINALIDAKLGAIENASY